MKNLLYLLLLLPLIACVKEDKIAKDEPVELRAPGCYDGQTFTEIMSGHPSQCDTATVTGYCITGPDQAGEKDVFGGIYIYDQWYDPDIPYAVDTGFIPVAFEGIATWTQNTLGNVFGYGPDEYSVCPDVHVGYMYDENNPNTTCFFYCVAGLCSNYSVPGGSLNQIDSIRFRAHRFYTPTQMVVYEIVKCMTPAVGLLANRCSLCGISHSRYQVDDHECDTTY